MLVSSDGFVVVDKVPQDVWTLSKEVDPRRRLCLNSALRLSRVDLELLPPPKWVNAMSQLTKGKVMWSQVMPPDEYRLFVKKLIKTIVGCFNELPKEYCAETWSPCGELLSSLKPAKIDTSLFKELVGGNHVLETFRPGGGGFASPVVYDRFGTRTGRLTVASGPNILTLKKEHRKVLRSFYPDGKICYLDFSSLEARIILYEAGVRPRGDDVYGQISEDLFGGKVSRDATKVAVLSELYGISKSALGNRLDMGGKQLDDFITSIRRYFKTPELRSRLKEEFLGRGKIHNKYGRPLFIDDASADHLLVNTYTQSTGVDVSLLGFKSIVDLIGTDGIRPLFVLHDALILDVRGDRLPDVESVKSTAVPGFEEKFPLKLESIG
jgi:hypothetical protein